MKLSSANSFSLEESKICHLGKGKNQGSFGKGEQCICIFLRFSYIFICSQAVYELIMTPEDMSNRTPEDLADELFDEADVDKDGLINFEEFEKAVTFDQTLVNILLPSPQQETNTEES